MIDPWMTRIHNDLLALGSYTAAIVTIGVVAIVWAIRKRKHWKIVIEADENGKEKEK